MDIRELECWVAVHQLVSVAETGHQWGWSFAEARERLELLAESSPEEFERIYSLSGWKGDCRMHALVSASELGTTLIDAAEKELFGLKARKVASIKLQSAALTTAVTRMEAAEAEDRLQPFSESGVQPLDQCRRSVYQHRRGPSPSGSRPSPLKRTAPSLPTPLKKPKLGRSLTIDHFFK